MIQEILTYLILLITLVAVFWKLYRLYFTLNKPKSNPEGKLEKCDSCSSGCALKELSSTPDCPPEKASQKG